LLNKLVFDKFKEGLGGRVRFMVSGGAPLSATTAEYLHVCFGVPVLQGYGLTETCGATAIAEYTCIDLRASHLGAPTLNTELKLVDVPQLNYFTQGKNENGEKDRPMGEIWVRGYGVAKGYYKNPTKTAEDFTEDGWFKTGDIAQLNPNLTISIIDRKKI